MISLLSLSSSPSFSSSLSPSHHHPHKYLHHRRYRHNNFLTNIKTTIVNAVQVLSINLIIIIYINAIANKKKTCRRPHQHHSSNQYHLYGQWYLPPIHLNIAINDSISKVIPTSKHPFPSRTPHLPLWSSTKSV